MKIGVLGTGMVGQLISMKLAELGHEVMIGSRTADNEAAVNFATSAGDNASNGTFTQAAQHGEIVFNCTRGTNSIEALNLAGSENLVGKTIVDVANVINHGEIGITVALPDGDSLGEQIQREFPESNVVKTFNTLNCSIMVNPKLVPGDHVVFLSGNSSAAKQQVRELQQEMGWNDNQLIDLGDITASRGTEMYLSLWLRLMSVVGTPNFNINIAR